jgi:hypothetical protein
LWFVCLGAPYGTHIWQVADLSQMNGAYKMALMVENCYYFKALTTKLNKRGFSTTNILHLVSKAWTKCFARLNTGKKAILQRGWNSLTYVLLDHPKLKSVIIKIDQELDS